MVALKDLKLKAEALNSLKLPVTEKAGFIGTITLKVSSGLNTFSLAGVWFLITADSMFILLTKFYMEGRSQSVTRGRWEFTG